MSGTNAIRGGSGQARVNRPATAAGYRHFNFNMNISGCDSNKLHSLMAKVNAALSARLQDSAKNPKIAEQLSKYEGHGEPILEFDYHISGTNLVINGLSFAPFMLYGEAPLAQTAFDVLISDAGDNFIEPIRKIIVETDDVCLLDRATSLLAGNTSNRKLSDVSLLNRGRQSIYARDLRVLNPNKYGKRENDTQTIFLAKRLKERLEIELNRIEHQRHRETEVIARSGLKVANQTADRGTRSLQMTEVAAAKVVYSFLKTG